MTDRQQKFLEQIALRIPRLFEAIGQGNVKSEYIIGVRRIGRRHVRLKIIAEVVDVGPNPLQTHGMTLSEEEPAEVVRADSVSFAPASKRRRPRKR